MGMSKTFDSFLTRVQKSGQPPQSGKTGSDWPTTRAEAHVTANIAKTWLRLHQKDPLTPFGLRRDQGRPHDRRTGESRGYGYIDYENETDAAEAMNKLNQHPYGNQLLDLSWAKSRPKF